MIELYPFGFACQGVAVRQKQKIKWAETFKAACSCITFFVNQTDYFLSLFLFDDGLIEHFRQMGNSIKGYSGACWCPFVWFDIDRPNLSDALSDVARLVEFMAQTPADSDSDSGLIVPDTESILLFVSGSKGFHVGVPVAVFGDDVKPGKDFPAQYKRTALEIARRAGVEIDRSIYDRQRLFRCPNSKHGKSGLYKIPLSFFELTACKTIDEIKQRAQHPRRLVWTESERDKVADVDTVRYLSAVKPVPVAVSLWKETQADMFSGLPAMGGAISKDKEKQSAVPAEQLPFNPWVRINHFPDGYEVPRIRRDTFEYIQHGAQEGERAVNLYNAVFDCLRCGWNRRAVESIFYDIGKQTGLHWSEVRKQIQAAFNSYEQEREVYNVK